MRSIRGLEVEGKGDGMWISGVGHTLLFMYMLNVYAMIYDTESIVSAALAFASRGLDTLSPLLAW